MRSTIWRSVLCLTGTILLTASGAAAQSTSEKAALKALTFTSSSEAAKTALNDALGEVQNIGGGRRYDAKLKRVVDLDPNFALGRAYYANWTSTLSMADRMKELDRALRDAVSASTAELLFIAALREARAGRGAAARDLTDVVLKHAPDDPGVHWYRLLIEGDADEAIRIGEQAVKRFPDFAPAYNILAYRLNSAGRKAEAIAAVQKYVSLEPNHPNPHDSYAEILSLQGQLDESDVHYRHAIGRDANYDVGHEGLAENAFKRGNYADARAHIEQALAMTLTPARRITLLRAQAALFALENRGKDAKQQLMTGIEIAEAASLTVQAQDNHRTLGFLAALENKKAEAVRHFAEARPATPGLYLPLTEALLYGLLGEAADVAKANAAMQANAATVPDVRAAQEAMHLTQLLDALARNDVAGARTHHGALTLPINRAYGSAFMVKPLTRAKDHAGVKAALEDVEAFKELSMNGALTRLIARRK